MKKDRLYVVLLTVIILGTFLAGCVVNKDHVHLKNESDLKDYAAENFSDFTFERYEEDDEKHTAYFTDNKCGFEFYVSSQVKSATFDGCVAGYEEGTVNSWARSYRAYLTDELIKQSPELSQGSGFVIEDNDDSYDTSLASNNMPVTFAYVKTDRSFEETGEVLRELGKTLLELDKHGLCKNCELSAYNGENRFNSEVAIYRIKDDTVITPEDKYAFVMLDRASEQLGVQCIFVKYEMLKYSEIPNSSRAEALEGLAPDREIGVCIFTTPDGKQKFIADFTKNNEYYIDDVEENLWED